MDYINPDMFSSKKAQKIFTDLIYLIDSDYKRLMDKIMEDDDLSQLAAVLNFRFARIQEAYKTAYGIDYQEELLTHHIGKMLSKDTQTTLH